MIVEYMLDDVNTSYSGGDTCDSGDTSDSGDSGDTIENEDDNDKFINIYSVNAENNISNIYHLFPLTIKCFIFTSLTCLYLL
jgi:hypothetical protein